MKRLSVLVLASISALALAGCNISLIFGNTYANSTSTAASLAVQAGFTGAYYGTPRAVGSRVFQTAVPSFIGSIYNSTVSGTSTTQSAFYLNSQAIIQNGKTYYLSGQVNYAFLTNTPNVIWIYAPNLSINGPDYSGTILVDLSGNYSATISSYTSMSCTVSGYVGSSYLINKTLSFYF